MQMNNRKKSYKYFLTIFDIIEKTKETKINKVV